MKKSFLIYQEWEEIFDSLSNEHAGQIIKAMFDHAKGEDTKLSTRVSLVFIPIRQQMDRNLKNYEHVSKVNSENAKKRWEQVQKDAKQSDGMRPHTNAYDKDKEEDKDITQKTSNKEKANASVLKDVSVASTVKHSTEDYWKAAIEASEGKL